MAELKAADIAARHGVDRKTAYRWMLELERKFGSRVIARRGKRGVLVTTEDAFAAVAPLAASKAKEDRRIKDLEERIADIECRADKTAERVGAVERAVKQLSLFR